MRTTETSILPNGNLLVTIPIDLRDRGNSKLIVTPDGEQSGNSRNSFLMAVARGFRWQKAMDTGAIKSIAELASLVGRDKSYVSRIIRLADLAPEVIERVIKDGLPPGLTISRTRKSIPNLWEEQMKEFFRD